MSFQKIAGNAESILASLKEKADTARQWAKENPELMYGAGGAGIGALLSHYLTDPENRSMATYLLGALGGGATGAIAGRVQKANRVPATTIPAQADQTAAGEDTGSGIGKTVSAGVGLIPAAIKKAVKLPWDISGGAAKGIAESAYKAKHGPLSLTSATSEMDSPETRARINKVLENEDHFFNPTTEYNQDSSDIPLSMPMKALQTGSKLAAYPLVLGLLLMGAGKIKGSGLGKKMMGPESGKGLMTAGKNLAWNWPVKGAKKVYDAAVS